MKLGFDHNVDTINIALLERVFFLNLGSHVTTNTYGYGFSSLSANPLFMLQVQ